MFSTSSLLLWSKCPEPNYKVFRSITWSNALKIPEPFLEIRATLLGDEYGTIALCAGYEGEAWRAKKLAGHILQWLPFAALSQESQNSFAMNNWEELISDAATHVYNTKKTKRRGEIGEVILHIACVTEFATTPVLCKLILKTSSNETVKGFDGIHVRLLPDDEYELWLGESKFYQDPKSAIKEAVESVRDHIAPNFLDTEKAMIAGHVAADVPKREELKKLFRKNTSSDELLKRAVFPVLIAYNSETSASFKEVSDDLSKALEVEIKNLRDEFAGRLDGLRLRFQLIFVPMNDKAELVKCFDKKLEAFL